MSRSPSFLRIFAAVNDDVRIERIEQELRHLRAELHRAHEDIAQLRAQLAGRDQEIRELRAKVTTRVLQVGMEGGGFAQQGPPAQ